MKCFGNEDYLRCKLRLEETYEIKANGVKIRSKCDWYEDGEKSSNKMKSITNLSHFTKIFFLNKLILYKMT